MELLILQTDADCGLTMAKAVEREVPSLRGLIRVFSSRDLGDETFILGLVEKNRDRLRIIILDAHLKLASYYNSGQRFGLKVYRQIALRDLSHIRIVITSYEARGTVAQEPEYKRFFDDDFISINPHLQLPVLADHLGVVVRRLLG